MSCPRLHKCLHGSVLFQKEKALMKCPYGRGIPSPTFPRLSDAVKLSKEEFGYDEVFNYRKETDFNAALRKYFPNGIDLYLDNVGGKMLEAVLNHVNRHACIAVCGMISQYDKPWTEREGIRNLLNLVGKEVRMQGFMLDSYCDRLGDFTNEMVSYRKEGKLRSKHKIYHGIDSFIESLGSLFSSSSVGKVLIQIKP